MTAAESSRAKLPYRAALFVASVLQVAGELCDNGIFCSPPKMCCGSQCCRLDSPGDVQPPFAAFYHLSFWNMWYFWFIVILVVLTCLGGCGYWRRRHLYLSSQSPRSRRSLDDDDDDFDSADDGSTPPTHRGPGPAPPPYSEVAAKPDLYPLVLGGCDYKDDIPPYSFINIHSFMHFTSGPLFLTSPVESNCSSLLPFSSSSIANTAYPPPYSDGACAASASTPGSIMSAYTPTDVSSLQHGPCSPPVATTPTSPNDSQLLAALVANIQSMTADARSTFSASASSNALDSSSDVPPAMPRSASAVAEDRPPLSLPARRTTSEGGSPVTDNLSCLSASRLFAPRRSEDTARLMECAVETDDFDRG